MKVIKGGIQTFVEDWPGRLLYLNKGLAVSGAADYYALRAGNLLVGNPTGEAALEILAGFFEAEFEESTAIAFTGADMGATINGEPVPIWQTIEVQKGDLLKVKSARGKGLICYLAVAGGIDVPSIWGSKSTCSTEGYGGYYGRKLAPGDVINFGKPYVLIKDVVGRKFKKELVPQYSSETKLRATVGPNAFPEFFTEEGIAKFFNKPYQVDNNANRGAYRLRIPKEDFKGVFARESGGMAGKHPSMTPMQPYRTPGGLNIGGDSAALLFVDGVSAGGFLCSLAVISADTWKIGQTVPLKGTIEFIPCTHEEASYLLAEQEKIFTLDSIE